jgi:2-dehydro-3-deoxyphosphogluconate aldolase/(4S)-4-hydroxy-2-oxoglutarate aldolase
MQTLNTMHDSGLVPVFYHPDSEVVISVAQAVADGGGRLIEFTNRGDGAYEVFRTLEQHCRKHIPQMITGVGSISEAGTASLYINDGASFVVGPSLNRDVADLCNRRKIAYSPGCGSVTEIAEAEALGVEIVKVFPGGQVGGPGFVKSVLGPCPWTSIMPTGGVDTSEESLREWFDAGIVCAGIGSNLITKQLLENKDYGGISKKVAATLKLISALKEQNIRKN